MNSNQTSQKFTVYLNTARVFTLAELKRNLLIYLLPLPFLIGLILYQCYQGARPLGLYGTWTMLITAAIFAMTYGLQCFSNETDKRTLDFILTRPLSPYLIIAVKYGLSLLFFLGWLGIFSVSAPLSLKLLPLVEGMDFSWILLILLMIHSISFFSGLLVKGLERFFVITVMTGLLAGISYYLWTSCLDLLKANVYWFDLLPLQLHFIKVVVPTFLALLSLATPLIGTVWYLRSRIPIWFFQPAKWLFGFWLGSFGLVLLGTWLLAPPVWPDDTAFYGDWHEQAGIVLSGPLKIVGEDSIHKITNKRIINCDISLAQFGRKSRRIYTGKNIIGPRFSPDGSKLVFTEQNQLKILDLKTRQLTVVGSGNIAAWSADSRKLVCAQQIGKENLSKLYIYDLTTKTTRVIDQFLQVSALAWDSLHNIIYYLGFKTEVGSYNLINKQIKFYTIKAEREKPLNYYGIVIPNMIFIPETGKIVWGHVYQDELRIYELDPQSGVIRLAENLVSSRMKNAAPVLINNQFKAFIWQRQEGSFVYQATLEYSHKDDHHHHDHCEQHEHHDVNDHHDFLDKHNYSGDN